MSLKIVKNRPFNRRLEDEKRILLTEEKRKRYGLEAGRCNAPRRERTLTGQSIVVACRSCEGCFRTKRDKVYGGSFAEVAQSAALLVLTLDYANVVGPDGEEVTPRSALRVDSRDFANFIRSVKGNGRYSVRCLTGSEYGGKFGRSHFHVAMFFQYPEGKRQECLEHFFTQGYPAGLHDWRDYVPELRIELNKLPNAEYQAAMDDPERLLIMPNKLKGNLPWQNWKHWPNGKVTADLVYSGDTFGLEMLLQRQSPESVWKRIWGGVSYVAKYMIKCPYKDGKDYKDFAFDDLPEWVKQNAKYTKDEKGRWQYGNPYFRKIKEEWEAKLRYSRTPDGSDIPLDDTPYFLMRPRDPRGGLGGNFLYELGKRRALLGPNMFDRVYSIFGVNKLHTGAQLAQMHASKGLPDSHISDKPWKFYMSDAQYVSFMDGFYAQRENIDGKPVDPRNMCQSYTAILERRIDVALRSKKGQFAREKLRNSQDANLGHDMEKAWADIPNDALEGLVPEDWIIQWEQTSTYDGWKKKRAERAVREKYGESIERWKLPDGAVLEVTKKRAHVYKRYLSNGSEWWSVVISCRNRLDQALAGKHPPPNAKIGYERFHALPRKPMKGMQRRTLRKKLRDVGAVRLSL